MPVYLIGFGATCSAVLCAATDETCVRSSEDTRLHDIICGRAKTEETSAPTRSWLAAVVLIAPSRDAFVPENIPHFEQIPTHFSLLVVVGARFRKEAITFRETFIRTRQQAVLGHNGTATPFVSDLRMLIIGGADYLLRMHPAALERFATTQAAIDQAIVVIILLNFLLKSNRNYFYINSFKQKVVSYVCFVHTMYTFKNNICKAMANFVLETTIFI